jgi:tetratricopeptide (TPR) repeat protein
LTNEEEENGMKVRLGLVLAAAVIISGTGCATGASEAGVSPAAPTGLGGQILPEGIRPRDNTHTRSADLYLTQAQTAATEEDAERRFQQALDASLAGIEQDPQNPKSYFQAAQAFVGLNDFAGADSMFNKAEELHPRYILETEPWREQGWVNAYNAAIDPLNAGELEESITLFEYANRLYSARPEAFLQLGSLYARVDRYPEAITAFGTAKELLEESRALQMEDPELAEVWKQHWEIANTGLGQVLTFSERWDEAAELYGAMLQEDPQNAQILGALAGVLTEMEQPDSVQALYQQLLSRTDLSERDLFNAGVGLYQIGEYDRAAESFRKAAEMNPFNRDARMNLAQTLHIAEKYESLIPASRELLEVDPLNGLAWIFLTRAYSELDRTDEANAVFLQYQDIGYELENIRLDSEPDGGARIVAQLKNNGAQPGSTVTLRFHFGGEDGREVGTLDVPVEMPEVDALQFFQGRFQSPHTVTGFRYEVVR